MSSLIATPEDYIASLSDDRKKVVEKLHQIILSNLDSRFSCGISYKMIAYGVPHSVHPNGYHCKPSEPVPFMNLASQKNYVAVYHMGLYNPNLLEWFKMEYPKYTTAKLDMGKCCIRFKKLNDIPYDLIGLLAAKISLDEWMKHYLEEIAK